MSRRLLPWLAVAAAAAGLAALPFFVTTYTTKTVTEIFILAIAAMGLDLVLGYTGLVSMGHAALFAMGAYAAGLTALHLTERFWITTAVGTLMAGLLAVVIGYFALRTTAATFIMVTLAFGQMFYALAVKWNAVTGGSDGLTGIGRPTGLGFEVTGENFYWLAGAACLLVFLFVRRVVASPFGHLLVGIRENEKRVRALGANVGRFKLAAFVLSGALAGFSGALFSQFNGFVSPAEAHWTLSGELLVMLVLGGSGTALGPLLGAAIVMILKNQISSYTDRWLTYVGILFIAVVLGARGGVAGLGRRVLGLWRARAAPARTRGETA